MVRFLKAIAISYQALITLKENLLKIKKYLLC